MLEGDFLADVLNVVVTNVTGFFGSWQGTVIRWMLVIYSILLFIGLVVLFMNHPSLWDYMWYGNRIKRDKGEKAKPTLPKTFWERTEAKLNSVNPNDWKIAVIEADKMLDASLMKAGFSGGTMGDKLKGATGEDLGVNLDRVWEAHKTRNDLVHDPSFVLANEDARSAVGVLKQASEHLEST